MVKRPVSRRSFWESKLGILLRLPLQVEVVVAVSSLQQLIAHS